MIMQVITLGESDLRDLAIIYMSKLEAFVYFMLAGVWMLSNYVLSTCLFGVLFPAYLTIMGVKWLVYVLDDDGIRGHGGRREYSSGGRGGRQEWRGRDKIKEGTTI